MVYRFGIAVLAVSLTVSVYADVPVALNYPTAFSDARTQFGHNNFQNIQIIDTSTGGVASTFRNDGMSNSYAASVSGVSLPGPSALTLTPNLHLPAADQNSRVPPYASVSVMSEASSSSQPLYTSAIADATVYYSFAIDAQSQFNVPVTMDYVIGAYAASSGISAAYLQATASVIITSPSGSATSIFSDSVSCRIDVCPSNDLNYRSTILNLSTNTPYDVLIYASNSTFNSDGIRNALTNSVAWAFSDPSFSIDPNFSRINEVQMRFSAGVNNIAAPVPEPSMLFQLLLGLAVFIGIRRRWFIRRDS